MNKKIKVVLSYISIIYTLSIFKCIVANELCTGADYMHGKWIEDESLWKDPSQNFITCNPGSMDNPYIKHICKGIVIEDHADTCLHNDISKRFGKRSLNSITEAEFRSYKPNSVKYRWQPSTCEMPKFDGHQFCKVLGQKKILIIGDSTSYQASGTLKTMIAQTDVQDESLFKCQEQIYFHWSDILVAPKNRAGAGRGESIAGDIMEEGVSGNFFDIIIFGNFHGAGITDHNSYSYNFTDPRFADGWLLKISQNINIAKRFYQAHGRPDPKFIYKSVSLPHADCVSHFDKGAITTELTGAADMKELNQINSHGLGAKYHWVGESILEHGILDVLSQQDDISVIRMFPLINRPDGHPPESINDCLHYCAPGPLNLFSQLFQHYLTVGDEAWRKNDAIYNNEMKSRKRNLRTRY